MTKGGARARSGPPPDPRALRRERDAGEWIHLPAIGRQGPTPDWPLSRATKRELVLWEREWRRPQAVMWEANGQELEVAFYVRTLREAESSGVKAAVRTLLRQQMEALGLTIPGLRANRWIIATEVAVAPRQGVAANARSVKERVRVVTGGGGA